MWLLVLVAGAVAGVVAVKRRPQPTVTVRAWVVRTGAVRDLVSTVTTGRVSARREANLRAEIAGRVLRLHHRRGERVTAGEVLVTYDARDLHDRLRVAESAVSLARAQGSQAEASARLAARNAERATLLRDRGAAPAAEAETLGAQAEVASRAVGASRAVEQQGMANVAAARTGLTRMVVRAPFAGVVLSTAVEEGEVTVPGAPMMALADVSELRVDGDLDEADLGRVRVGMPAEVSFDAFPGERIMGRVSEIAPSVTQDIRGNRSIGMRVTLPVDPRLRVGMSADVDVVVATREGVVYVPPSTVLGRGTDRGVYVVEAGVARRRPVTVGIATWESVEVRSGLRAGETLVLNTTVTGLGDGTAVRVRSTDTGRGTP